MKLSDFQNHADLIRRVIERAKATPDGNRVAVFILEMLEHEYRQAHQIMPIDPKLK